MLEAKTLSYSAGSTSIDPYKFRYVDEAGGNGRLALIAEKFPGVGSILRSPLQPLVISAYPATLGGFTGLPFVDSYMHPATVIRAMDLAANESRSVVFAAQPLVGADLLLQALRRSSRFPTKLLWACGGYPLPRSLEFAVRQWLAKRDCQLTVLHCYGIAELDHTLLAAVDRSDDGQPRYEVIHPDLKLDLHSKDSRRIITLELHGRSIDVEDNLAMVNGAIRVAGNPMRFDEVVLDRLETWRPMDWERHTGHLAFDAKLVFAQRRHHQSTGSMNQSTSFWSPRTIKADRPTLIALTRADVQGGLTGKRQTMPHRIESLGFHPFAERFHMTWHQKPTWTNGVSQPDQACEVDAVHARAA